MVLLCSVQEETTVNQMPLSPSTTKRTLQYSMIYMCMCVLVAYCKIIQNLRRLIIILCKINKITVHLSLESKPMPV